MILKSVYSHKVERKTNCDLYSSSNSCTKLIHRLSMNVRPRAKVEHSLSSAYEIILVIPRMECFNVKKKNSLANYLRVLDNINILIVGFPCTVRLNRLNLPRENRNDTKASPFPSLPLAANTRYLEGEPRKAAHTYFQLFELLQSTRISNYKTRHRLKQKKY